MRWAARCLVTVALALALPACGDSGDDLSPLAAATLQGQVGEVRAAVVAQDPQDARLELAELRAAVTRLRGGDELSDERAEAILAAADAVESHLGLLRRPAAPSTTQAGRGDARGDDADDLQETIDEAVRKRVEEARKRAEEQIKEAEKQAEEAEKQAEEAENDAGGGGGRGRGRD